MSQNAARGGCCTKFSRIYSCSSLGCPGHQNWTGVFRVGWASWAIQADDLLACLFSGFVCFSSPPPHAKKIPFQTNTKPLQTAKNTKPTNQHARHLARRPPGGVYTRLRKQGLCHEGAESTGSSPHPPPSRAPANTYWPKALGFGVTIHKFLWPIELWIWTRNPQGDIHI